MLEHEVFMQLGIVLALKGAGHVSPNPMVGALVVHDNTVIGEGYHEKYGAAHAEVNAINDVFARFGDQAPALLKQSTIYVTLEPCAHFGKTPPCSDLIIRHGIPNVVVGCRDPFDQVDGKGIEKLRHAGIDVIVGVLEKECRELNKRFFTRVEKKRPYVILKWAQTADHFFAPLGDAQFWISGPEAKRLVHQWRSEEDAILVGKRTALIDNPQLNVREWQGANPKRIVIDKDLTLPTSLHLFDNSVETIVINAVKTDVSGNTKYIQLESFDYYLPQMILFQLYLLDIQSIIIEGGAQTLQLFIDAGMWDEARIFTGDKLLMSGIPAPKVEGDILSKEMVGSDQLTIYRHSSISL